MEVTMAVTCLHQCIIPTDLQPGTFSKGSSTPQAAVTTNIPALVKRGKEGVMDSRYPAKSGAATPVL